MKDLSLSIKPVTLFIAKHHAVLFICTLSLLLAAAVYALYDTSRQAEAPSESLTTSTIPEFDKQTIEAIKKLNDSKNASTDLTFPSSRYTPFVE